MDEVTNSEIMDAFWELDTLSDRLSVLIYVMGKTHLGRARLVTAMFLLFAFGVAVYGNFGLEGASVYAAALLVAAGVAALLLMPRH